MTAIHPQASAHPKTLTMVTQHSVENSSRDSGDPGVIAQTHSPEIHSPWQTLAAIYPHAPTAPASFVMAPRRRSAIDVGMGTYDRNAWAYPRERHRATVVVMGIQEWEGGGGDVVAVGGGGGGAFDAATCRGDHRATF